MRTPNILASLFAGGILLASTVVAAQDFSITSISVPGTISGAFTAGTPYVSTVRYDKTPSFRSADHTASFELLAGPKECSTNDVVDIMCENESMISLSCKYFFSRSVPAGSYHFRVNVTNSTSPPTLSETFNVAAFVPDCVPPPPWTNVVSTSGPNRTSLQLVSPPADYADILFPIYGGGVVAEWRLLLEVQ